jgi:hypothetical protein
MGFATAATFGAGAVVLGLTAAQVGSIAAGAAMVASVGGALLAEKPPAATGGVNNILIGANQPRPYLIGETYYGGNRINQEGFGGKVSKVNNPYLLLVDVYSGAGPVAGMVSPYLDFVPVVLNGNAATGYAANHLYIYHQTGRSPEPQALSTHWGGAQTWGPQYKLSSYAAMSWCLRFDEDGKRFAAGVPQTGAVWRGVLAYDPRKDSTYPGGSGPHRWADPANTAAFSAAKKTWEWTRCPGLQGLRYALGTWDRDENNPAASYRKTFGIGIPIDGVRVADFVALANVCDANGWHVDGVIVEPSNRDDNLKNILQAGGAERCWVGGKLGLKVSAPRVPLDTITEYDLANDEVEIGAMQGWENRLNTIIPKFRSPDHKWEYVPSQAVTIASYVAEDGEEKTEERQYNLVQSNDQAAQLAAYELLDARELGEIVLNCKPRLRRYGAGDLLIVHLPDDGLVQQPCVVLKRTIDPVEMTVELILRGETAAKHDFALGRTGTAPPTPRLVAGDVLDDIAIDVPLPWDAVQGPRKPEDNATRGAPVGTPVAGRPAEEVVADLDVAMGNLLTEMLRHATFRGESDEIWYLPDGTPVRAVTQVLSALVDGNTAYIADLRQVDGNGNLKAAFVLNSNGHVTGVTQLNDGKTGSFYVVADEFGFVDPAGGDQAQPIKPLYYSGGKLYMDNVYIRKLDVDVVTMGNIAPGQVTGMSGIAFADVLVTGNEVEIASVANLTIGDSKDGRATIELQFTHDATAVPDAGMLLRCYVDQGSGYGLVAQETRGARVGGGDIRYIFGSSMSVVVNAKGKVNVRFTGQAVSIGGGGINQSTARNVRVNVNAGYR